MDEINAALAVAGLYSVEVAPDGNCLPRALSFALWGDDAYHNVVREAAVAQIAASPDLYEVLAELLPGETMAEWHERMSRDGEWGDAAFLHAVAAAYGRNATVIMPHGVETYFAATTGEAAEDDSPPLVITLAHQHYGGVEMDELDDEIPSNLLEQVDACLRVSVSECDEDDDALDYIDDDNEACICPSDLELSDEDDDARSQEDDDDDDDQDGVKHPSGPVAHPSHLPDGRQVYDLEPEEFEAFKDAFACVYNHAYLDRTTSWGWKAVLGGEAVFDGPDEAAHRLFNAFAELIHPRLVALLVRAATGGAVPSAEELASIGDYKVDGALAYIKVAVPRKGSGVKPIIYVGHTTQPIARRAAHLLNVARRRPARGFQNALLRSPRGTYDIAFVGAYFVPADHWTADMSTLAVHFVECMLALWLAAVSQGSVRERCSIYPLADFKYEPGNGHSPFFEHPRTVPGRSDDEKRLHHNDQIRRRYHAMPEAWREERRAGYRRGNLSEERLEEVREYTRAWKAQRTPEQRRAALDQARNSAVQQASRAARKARRPDEEWERLRAYSRARREALPPEKKAAQLETAQRWYANLDAEQRQRRLDKATARRHDRTEEQKQSVKEKSAAAWAATTREQRDAINMKQKAWYATRPEAAKEKKKQQMRDRNKNLTEAQKAERNAKARERRRNRSAEKKAEDSRKNAERNRERRKKR